jgi:HEAT repeat protein
MIRSLCRALAKIGDLRATPALIDLLGSGNGEIRSEAATALRFLTRTMHGFDADGPEKQREAAILRWREWWERELRKRTK